MAKCKEWEAAAESKIREIVETRTYLQKEDGWYADKICADPGDKLQDEQTQAIFLSADPWVAFWEELDRMYWTWGVEEHSEIIKTILRCWEDGEGKFRAHRDKEFVRDWVRQNVYFDYPEDHYLDQPVRMNIIVDAGDGNHDFTRNNFFNYCAKEYCAEERESREIPSKSSLVWLMRQQGYGDGEIIKFFADGDCQGSRFLKSVKEESENCGSRMNALTFFVGMTLREAIRLDEGLKAAKEGKTNGQVLRIGKTSNCGLMDFWHGSGGMLAIKLDRDVELPVGMIDSALPDGCRGPHGGIEEIFGIDRSLWTPAAVELKSA